MTSLTSFLLLLFTAVAQAISSSGSRLLVVLEDVAEKAQYSKFLGDLEGVHAIPLCLLMNMFICLVVDILTLLSALQVGDSRSHTRLPRANL